MSAGEYRESAPHGGVPRSKKNCAYCRMDITNVMHVNCTDPACRDMDICLHCASKGYAVYPHVISHPYRIIDHISTPIYTSEWGADEELALLNAIDKFGLGNWSDVSQMIGLKNEMECQGHYYSIYLQSATAPLPDNTKPLSNQPKTGDQWRSKLQHVETESDMHRWKQQQQDFRAQQKNTLASLVGYLPQRNDFEVEYLNDAEKDISDLDFKPTDTQAEREQKLKVLEIYNNILDQRAERKEVVEKYQLLLKRDRRQTREEKEVTKALRPFCRFLEPHEFDELVRSMVTERALRARIEQQQVYRQNGVRTLADGVVFESDYARLQATWLQKHAAQYEGFCAVPQGVDVEVRNVLKKVATSVDQEPALKRQKVEEARKLKVEEQKPERVCLCGSVCTFDVSRMEGVELQSKAEQMLCLELHMIPSHYLVIKEQLIRESIAHGFITQGHARNIIKVDIQSTDKILHFCVSSGLLSTVKQEQ